MASKYRLSPKPGLARAGRFVSTKVNPVIVKSKPSIVQLQKQGPMAQQPQQLQSQKIQPNQKVQKANIQRSVGPNKIVNQVQRNRLKQAKSSPIRNVKERDMGQHKSKVEGLKGVGAGRVLVMVACGPSILEADLPKLKNHPLIDIMSINKPDERLHPTKYWVFCDQSQYKRNTELFESYTGTVINAWSVRARHPNQILIRNRSGKGFSRNLLDGYYIGRSTTFANMQTAMWMGYEKIYIFGLDMCKPPNTDSLHFYGKNEDVAPDVRVKRFQKEAEHYMEGTKQLTPQERLKFVICSAYNPWPFVEHYKRLDHVTAVDEIINFAEKLDKNKS